VEMKPLNKEKESMQLQWNSQRIKPYTFAIRTSRHTVQKLQKSMSLPTLLTEW